MFEAAALDASTLTRRGMAKFVQARGGTACIIADCWSSISHSLQFPSATPPTPQNDVEGSVRDFDAVLALDARQAPFLWQRGLSLYYLGRFEDGARQFRNDVAVNPSDTEEARRLSRATHVDSWFPAACRMQSFLISTVLARPG